MIQPTEILKGSLDASLETEQLLKTLTHYDDINVHTSSDKLVKFGSPPSWCIFQKFPAQNTLFEILKELRRLPCHSSSEPAKFSLSSLFRNAAETVVNLFETCFAMFKSMSRGCHKCILEHTI